MTDIPKLRKALDNRIVGHDIVAVDQLLAHPHNWRLHPKYQQDALAGAIDEVGYIRSITVNQRTGTVLDGHLRVTLAARSGVEALPVEYVDLDEEQEVKALLLLDPIAAMAEADREKMGELLQMIQTDDERVMEAVSKIAADAGVVPPHFEPVDESEQPRLDQKSPVTCPECGAEFVPK